MCIRDRSSARAALESAAKESNIVIARTPVFILESPWVGLAVAYGRWYPEVAPVAIPIGPPIQRWARPLQDDSRSGLPSSHFRLKRIFDISHGPRSRESWKS